MVGEHRKLIKHTAILGLGIGFLVGGCGGAFAELPTKLQQAYQAHRAYEAGLERYQKRDYAGAIPLFRQALELDPKFDDAEANLAWSYYYTEEFQDATRHFRQALARQPKWEGLHDGLGWSRFRVKRYYLALESFRQALALDANYRDAAVGFAYTLFELGRYAEALPQLERLTREGEGSAFRSPLRDVEEVRSRYAWTLFYLGDYPRARMEFTKGIAARPNWAGLHNGLGWTYLRLGDRARAQASFQQALKFQADYPDAKEGLAMARQ